MRLKFYFLYLIVLINDCLSATYAVTDRFRQGSLPTAAYTGCEDAQIASGSQANTNYNNGYPTGTEFSVDANNGGRMTWVLMRFDLSSIPAGSTVSAVRLVLNCTNSSPGTYTIYQVLRTWSETNVTYNQYSPGNNWTTAGANGIGTDRLNTGLANTPTNFTGTATINWNANGVTLVQNWINTPASNQGFIFYNNANTDGFDFNSSEDPTVNLRPMLEVDYTPFAINLLALKASLIDNQAKIDWAVYVYQTEAEFSVERSTNKIDFEPIGNSIRLSPSSELKHFSIWDNTLTPGDTKLWYRLRIKDADGSITYSQITELNIINLSALPKLWPNPANEIIYITIPFEVAEKYSGWLLVNSQGQIIKKGTYTAINQSIDVSDLAVGMYYFQLENNPKLSARFLKY